MIKFLYLLIQGCVPYCCFGEGDNEDENEEEDSEMIAISESRRMPDGRRITDRQRGEEVRFFPSQERRT